MAREDPVERAARDESIQEVTDWEPTTPVDRLAVALYAGIRQGSRWAVVLLAVVVTALTVAVTELDLVVEPTIAWLVALSAAPALGLAAYLRWIDVTTEEPLSVLAVTFLLAVLTASVAGVLNAVGVGLRAAFVGPFGPTVAILAYYFLIVAPVEESVKLLSVRLFAYDHHRFDAVIDGAVYGAAAGLGFATIENALYITDVVQGAGGIGVASSGRLEDIATARAFVGPGHVLYSAIAGYYLGLAKFTPEHRGPIVVKGLLVAALFHGAYNSTIGVGGRIVQSFTPLSGLSAVLAYVVCFQVVVGYYLYRKLDRYRRAYRESGAGEPEGDHLPEPTEFDP